MEDVDFVLIGAGLPRTGSLSTFAALEMILPGKCHHMVRVGADRSGGNMRHWVRACKETVPDEEWKEFIRKERISAGVDFPTSLFWKDLMRIYPDAKILFNDRDPAKWYHSVKNSILQVSYASQSFWSFPFRLLFPNHLEAPNIICRAQRRDQWGESWPGGLFGAVEQGEEQAVRYYQEWKEDVLATVPPERLLVWHPKEGWGPLCQFLGVPEPQEPFPSLNDTASMQKKIKMFKMVRTAFWTLVVGGLAVGLHYFQPLLLSNMFKKFI